MKLTIDRIHSSKLNIKGFMKEYYNLDKPVIITGISVGRKNKLEDFKSHFEKEENKSFGWFDSSVDHAKKLHIQMPKVVASVFNAGNVSLREKPVRAFMHKKGHVTLAHYDGNSLNGFNLQLAGKKKWLLISPESPIPMVPFLYVCALKHSKQINYNKVDGYEFETNPGEMLFIPRYWIHKVESIGDINTNISWVGTPNSPNTKSKLGRREIEILALRNAIPFLNKFFKDNFKEYGGKDMSLLRNYIKNVSFFSMAKRFVKEIGCMFSMPFYAKDIKMQAKAFNVNNFNLEKSITCS